MSVLQMHGQLSCVCLGNTQGQIPHESQRTCFALGALYWENPTLPLAALFLLFHLGESQRQSSIYVGKTQQCKDNFSTPS